MNKILLILLFILLIFTIFLELNNYRCYIERFEVDNEPVNEKIKDYLDTLHELLKSDNKHRKEHILNDDSFKNILNIKTNQNDYSNIITCYTDENKFNQLTPNIKLLKDKNESLLDVINRSKDNKKEYNWSAPHKLGDIEYDGSTKVLKHIYDLIVSAEKTITITTLLGSGLFINYLFDKLYLDIIKNALEKNNNNNLNIRILSGYPEAYIHAKSLEDQTIKYLDLKSKDHTITCCIHCATQKYMDSASIWNHSKIIMVDGSSFLIGGQNLWENQYLSKNYLNNKGPISDTNVSFFTNNSEYVINFCSILFKESIKKQFGKPKIIKNKRIIELTENDIVDFTQIEYEISLNKKYKNTIFKNNKTHFKGMFIFKYLNTINDQQYIDASENSMLLSFSKIAKQTIYISQQKIKGSLRKWHTNLLISFSTALNKGVKIKCILSNNKAAAGYESIYTINTIKKDLLQYGCDQNKLNNFELRYFSYDNKSISGQHTKMWCIDGKLLSIGSHNMYYTPLAQSSILISNEQLIKNYLDNDFHIKWNYAIQTN